VREAYVKRRVRPSRDIVGTSKTDVRVTFESLFFRRGRLFEEAVNKLSRRQGAGRSGAAPVRQSNLQCTRSEHAMAPHYSPFQADNRSDANESLLPTKTKVYYRV
jgi:hypothetical protein